MNIRVMTTTVEELHKRVISYKAMQKRKNYIAATLKLPLSTEYSIEKLFKETGSHSKRENGGGPRSRRTETTLVKAVDTNIKSIKEDCSIRHL